MPMSVAKPISVSSVYPLRTIVIGSARKVFCTKPPSVATAHTAKNSTKKAMPSTTRVPGATGTSGFIDDRPCGLFQKTRIGQVGQVRHLPDDAALQQQRSRLLAELGMLAGEELLVRLAVLPAQVGLALLEGLGALLHIRAHDLEALLRLGLDHRQIGRASCRERE